MSLQKKKWPWIIFALVVLLAIISVIRGPEKTVRSLLKIVPSSLEQRWAQSSMPTKVWLHRVDSPEKQVEFAQKYRSGIEMDLIFHEKEGQFENSHDPESLSAHPLEKQFVTYRDLGIERGLWLDFKNLSFANSVAALSELERLVAIISPIGTIGKGEKIRASIWVESRDWRPLQGFHEAGFKTSFYLPSYQTETMTTEQKDVARKEIMEAVESGVIDAISFPGSTYEFIRSLNLPPTVSFLCWEDSHPWWAVTYFSQYRALLADPRMKIILVKDHGHFQR